VLVGDYHALPACQRFAAALLEQRALVGDRPVVLEWRRYFARDQHIWRNGAAGDRGRGTARADALPTRLGYEWSFYELLVTGANIAEAIYGLGLRVRAKTCGRLARGTGTRRTR